MKLQDLPVTERLILAEIIDSSEPLDEDKLTLAPVDQETLKNVIEGTWGVTPDFHSSVMSLVGKGVLNRERYTLKESEFYNLIVTQKGETLITEGEV